MGESWEYADADTKYHVHGLHLYPARMIPQIAGRLIQENSSEGQIVLDPFCGSGSVLVEALILGRNALGIDVNPLAIMIARAKTIAIDPLDLNRAADRLLGNIQKKISLNRENKYEPGVFYFKNLYHWFKREVVNDLSIIKKCIDELQIKNKPVLNFFRVCFSATVLKSSNIAFADNPYFARAKSGEALENHSPDVIRIFEENLRDCTSRMEEYYGVLPKSVSSKIFEHDSRSMPLKDNSVDLIVTSPPYGEESHTMSYSRFAKLSLRWLDFTPSDIDRQTAKSLGGVATAYRPVSPTLDSLYEKLSEKNKKRARDVFSFFWDYKKTIEEMYRVVRENCLACIVIGDRTAARLPVSNGRLTEELGEASGFEHVSTYQREIPKKVLPRRDYKVDLINRESIVLLKKV
jgi:DNA modification methylase